MHRFLSRHLQILRSLVLSVSLSVLSISVTNFMSVLKRAVIIELLWTKSRCHGVWCAYPPKQSPQPPKLQY